MKDVLGEAIADYYHKKQSGKLWIHNKYGPKEEMPVDTYFRDVNEMPELELFAMNICKGRILDIGAGAGSHSLALQNSHADVTALEISPKAAEIIKARGVEKVITTDVFSFSDGKFDTLLLLMNGIGLTGSIKRLQVFLDHARLLLNKNGQLLFDSSDVVYLYKGKQAERIAAESGYYGEIFYQYEYKKQKTEWFSWLYIDEHTLTRIATTAGWKCEVLYENEYDQYLVRLTM